MSLADVTSRLAQELAQLRREQATLIGDLAQTKAKLAARERQVELLVEQLETTGQALETAARRAVMAELAHAGAETSLGAARAEAAILRAERDTARRAGWALTQELGVLEGALATGWLRRTRARRHGRAGPRGRSCSPSPWVWRARSCRRSSRWCAQRRRGRRCC